MQDKRMSLIAITMFACYAGSALGATNLALSLEQTDCQAATPSGIAITIQVKGQLSGDSSLGLAGFAFDLSATKEGVDYDITDVVIAPGYTNFARPAGITNAAGFGGAADGLDLLQIGGAQNTIDHSGTFPNGTVTTGIGTTQADVLATIVVTLPHDFEDSYVLSINGVKANVLETALVSGYTTRPVCTLGAAASIELEPCGACTATGSCTDWLTSTECEDLRYKCDIVALGAPSPGCYGDASLDGVVNASDRGFVSANIGITISDVPSLISTVEAFYDELCKVDMDGSGVVNASDRGYVSANIGLCTTLEDFQNGSGLNGGQPDPRFDAVFTVGQTCP